MKPGIQMSTSFKYDVFLSHSSKDKHMVTKLARRLKADGLRVWFDDWNVWPGDLIGLKVEEGLQTSRTLVLCISANALASDWVTLERHTAMFRDPANKQRRFIPLVLDDSPLTDALKQFAHVDWRRESEDQYARLFTACRYGGNHRNSDLISNIETERQQNRRHPLFRLWSRIWAKNLEAGVSATQKQFIDSRPDAPDYELADYPFGEGSYGKVWLARNAIGQWQALKAVYISKFGKSTAPYEREFRGITSFKPLSERHPGLLKIDFVSRRKPEGYFYYVMELGDAQESGWERNPVKYRPRDLTSILQASNSKHLSVSECLKIGIPLASTVEFLHDQGVTHRDIKPSNVIFVNGRPKLADVGLVTEIQESGSAIAGSYLGTPGYIPPPPEITGTIQADIYSLGMLLYKIATGNDPTAFPDIPERLLESLEFGDFHELNEVILKACDPDRKNRFGSTAELHASLQKIQDSRNAP